MTATPVGAGPGVQIEYTGSFAPYMGVDAGPQAKGVGPYYANYANWGFVSVPISAIDPDASDNLYGVNSTTPVNSLTLYLDNSSSSGEYGPVAGTFGVYLMPPDPSGSPTNPVSSSNLFYGVGATRIKGSTATDLAALGSNWGTNDAASLGVTSAYEIGTFTITSGLALGYSHWTFTGLSSTVESQLAYDINQYADHSNNSTPIDLAIVSEGTGASGAADWYGSQTGETPEIEMDVNEVPAGGVTETYNVGYPNVNVNETEGNVEVDVLRTGFTGDATTLDYTATTLGGQNAVSGTNYTGTTSGTVAFASGQTQAEISVPILDASPQGGNKMFTVTLTGDTPTQGDDTASIGSNATTAVTIIDSANTTSTFSGAASEATNIETDGPYDSTYGDVNGGTNGTGSFEYQAFEVYEFDPTNTPSLFAGTGQNVTALDNLSLQIYNTATTGNYAGHVGDFNVYYLQDSQTTTPTSGMTFETADVGGLNGQGTPILLGTFSFNNDKVGFDTYTPASINSTVASDIVSDMNTGTAFRLAVTPGRRFCGGLGRGIRPRYADPRPGSNLHPIPG